jgi:short-subunit dehydrogenase
MNILITGASRGFGWAIAEKFAAAGYNIFMTARTEPVLEKAARSLEQSFPSIKVNYKSADLSNKQEVVSLAEWFKGYKVSLDVLINNAGSFIPGSVHNEPEGALEKMLDTNLMSAYHLTRLLIPGMMERKQGHVFTICSIASLQAYANGGAYSISKFALLGFSKNLREEMKPHGIKVTSVLPGAAYTDSWKGSGVDPKRIMESEDIAQMILAASQLSPQACVEEIVMRPLLGDL